MPQAQVIRCPWCTARVAEGARCAACGCDPIDASDYGVARMLQAAGVDRLALPERARALDAATRTRLHDEWRAQRELALALYADAERACASLPTGARLLAEVDDELARSFPVPPARADALRWHERPSGVDERAFLDAMRATHPLWGARAAALLALAWGCELGRERADQVHALVGAEGVVAASAAALLCGWRARRAGAAPRRLGEHLERALRAGLALPELAPHAAVALALAGAREGVLGVLDAVRDDSPTELRLGAALALDDEARLAAFLDDADPERREAARRALAALGSARLVPLLVGGEDRPLPPDAERRALLRVLPEPLPPLLRDAVMACAEQGGAELVADALRVLQRGRLSQREPEERALLGAFARKNAARLGATHALALLAWAAEDPPAAVELAPFVAGARAALEAASLPTRADERELDVFLRLAAAAELAPLDALLEEPERGALLLGLVLDLWAHRERHGLAVLWLEERCTRWWSARAASVDAWARALGSRTGMSGRDDVLAFFWRRFCSQPAERAAIATALERWRHLLHEARAAAPPSERPGGDDVVAVWEIWAAAEPGEMWRLVDELNPTVPAEHLARFAERVIDAAEGVVAERPRTGVVTVFRVCAEIANRIRQAPPSEHLDAAAAVIERRLPAFVERFAAARACEDGERGAEHFLDDIATERRLIAEVDERRREQAARAAAREEQRLEQARRAEAASIVVATPPAAPPPATPVALPQPDFQRGGFDDEPFLPGPGPRTLVEYAQLLKALQLGQDALAVFAAFGLDVPAWVACANRWAALLTSRPDVALRFGALLSERWR